MNTPGTTVIIPTMATRERSSSLFRALAAIQGQGIPCRIIVVVNGKKRDPQVVSGLKRAVDIELLTLEEGNLVKALAAGVEAVQTTYFSVLDDDDILLPGACEKRFQYMETHPEADALVTPGEKAFVDERSERMPLRFNADDPLTSLFDYNWLTPCGGIYRRSRVGPEYFASMPRYLEWTYLAFRLIRERRVHFCVDDPEPHFRMYETAGSESQKLEYFATMPENLLQMRDPSLPRHVQRLLADKFARALHEAATQCLSNGRITEAWRFHVRCLVNRDGIRFLPFTRHLILATFQPARNASDPKV
jgi:glycosyltransferase involved in cell wall biosynthesis